MKPRRVSVAVLLVAVVVGLLWSSVTAVEALQPAVSRGALLRTVKPAVVAPVDADAEADVESADDEDADAAADEEAEAEDVAFVQVHTRVHTHESAAAALDAAAGAEAEADDNKPQAAPRAKPMVVDDSTQIHGKIKLNGQHFKTDCDCKEVSDDSKAMRFSEDDPCVTPPSKFRVRQEAFNRKMGLSIPQVHALLGKPRDAVLVRVDDVSFGTTDARETEPILATPGGDFGELFLALAEYEAMTKRAFTDAEVGRILASWLKWPARGSRPLALQTDEAALLHVQQNLHYNGEKGKVVGLDLDSPKAEYQTELLKDLPHAKNTGCYYLKSILDAPARFFVRPELLPALIRAFYRILWDKSTLVDAKDPSLGPLYNRVKLNILQGEPAPKAWINFRASHSCERKRMAPVWRPFPVTTSRAAHASPVIVNHPEASKVVRMRLAKFFSLFNPMLSERAFVAKLNHRGNTYMELAAEVLGSQVPYYTVTVE